MRKGISAGRGVRWRRFFGQWGAVVALGWVVLLIVVAVFAPLIATHSPTAQDLTHPFAGASSSHWLGTDDLGRDVFARSGVRDAGVLAGRLRGGRPGACSLRYRSGCSRAIGAGRSTTGSCG